MNTDVWQSLIRRLVTMLAGALISHGVISAESVSREAVEAITGAVLAIATTVWSVSHQTKMKGGTVCQSKPEPPSK